MPSSVTINGQTYVAGRDITVNGNKVYIDGKPVDDGKEFSGILKVEVTGDLASLSSDVAVEVSGNVHGNVTAGNSVNCGDVGGNVKAGNSVNCDDVGGDVSAGNSVNRG